MVISDGAPVDDSTLSTNSSDYLEVNLKNTVKWIENKTNIELLAIGIITMMSLSTIVKQLKSRMFKI